MLRSRSEMLRVMLPPSVSRLGAHSARSTPRDDRWGRPATRSRRGCGAACVTPGRRSTRCEQCSSKPSASRARSCRVAGARDAADDRAGSVRDARVGDLHREHERHANRDPHTRKQLLDGARAQPPAVEVEQPEAHAPTRTPCGAPARGRPSVERSSPLSLPSRSVQPVGDRGRLRVVGDEQHRRRRAHGDLREQRDDLRAALRCRGCRSAHRRGSAAARSTSARAIATRWRSPPESCSGVRRAVAEPDPLEPCGCRRGAPRRPDPPSSSLIAAFSTPGTRPSDGGW